MNNLCGKIQRLMLAFVFLALPARSQTITSMVNAVSDSALFETISGLQGFETRWCQSGNEWPVSKWFRGKFAELGLTNVLLDSFPYGNTPEANVVATLPGTRYPNKEIIVGGHIDSYSSDRNHAPGADDDASGAAAVLEVARVLVSSGYKPSATIRFLGFAAEEAGLIGSSHYARKAKEENRDITMMMNFDMIGYTSSANPQRRFNIVYYPPDTETSDLVVSAATSYTSLTPLKSVRYQASVDSYSFAIEGYLSVTCIEYEDDFNPYYHSPNDLISHLDTSYVRDITKTGLAAILLTDAMLATSVAPPSTVPVASSLEQNWPNPFNPRTVVSSQYSVVSNVKIVIYDMLGREVATLVNERRAPGIYHDTFDATGLASGVYIYRMTAGAFTQSRKMILMK
jgi:hypothetical protein